MLKSSSDGFKEVEFILEAAKRKYLEAGDVLTLLDYGQQGMIKPIPEVQQRPASGAMFLYDRNHIDSFRLDGHDWIKKRGAQMAIREDHVRLKVNGELRIYACHAHSALSKTFHRRAYWDMKDKSNSLVLVHFLDTALGPNVTHLNCNCLTCTISAEKAKIENNPQHPPMMNLLAPTEITLPDLGDKECSDFLDGVDFIDHDLLLSSPRKVDTTELEIEDFAPERVDRAGGTKILITTTVKSGLPGSLAPIDPNLKVSVKFGKCKPVAAAISAAGVIRCQTPRLTGDSPARFSVTIGGVKCQPRKGLNLQVTFEPKPEVLPAPSFQSTQQGYYGMYSPQPMPIVHPSMPSGGTPQLTQSPPPPQPYPYGMPPPPGQSQPTSNWGMQNGVMHRPMAQPGYTMNGMPMYHHPPYHTHSPYTNMSQPQNPNHLPTFSSVSPVSTASPSDRNVRPQTPSAPKLKHEELIPPQFDERQGSRPNSAPSNAGLPARRLLKRKLNRTPTSGEQETTLDERDVDLMTEEELSELSESLLERVVRVVVEITKQEVDLAGEIDVLDDTGFNLLHYSVTFSHEKLVKLLLDHGADVNKRTSTGDTPLHLAAETGDVGIVKRLMKAGGDPNLLDLDRLTCAELATKYGHHELAQWIMERAGILPRVASRSISSTSSSSSSVSFKFPGEEPIQNSLLSADLSSPTSSLGAFSSTSDRHWGEGGSGKLSESSIAMMKDRVDEDGLENFAASPTLSPLPMETDLFDSSKPSESVEPWKQCLQDSPAKESREDKQHKMLRKALASLSLKDRCALSLGMSSTPSALDLSTFEEAESHPDMSHEQSGVKSIVSENESALQPVISAMHDDERSELEAEARIIQTNFRRWMLRRNVMAARRMQTETSGFLENKEVENKATKVQAVSKGFLARREYKQVRQEVIHMQAAARGLLARKSFQSWRRQLSAAMVIQRSIRAHQLRLKAGGTQEIDSQL